MSLAESDSKTSGPPNRGWLKRGQAIQSRTGLKGHLFEPEMPKRTKAWIPWRKWKRAEWESEKAETVAALTPVEIKEALVKEWWRNVDGDTQRHFNDDGSGEERRVRGAPRGEALLAALAAA